MAPISILVVIRTATTMVLLTSRSTTVTRVLLAGRTAPLASYLVEISTMRVLSVLQISSITTYRTFWVQAAGFSMRVLFSILRVEVLVLLLVSSLSPASDRHYPTRRSSSQMQPPSLGSCRPFIWIVGVTLKIPTSDLRFTVLVPARPLSSPKPFVHFRTAVVF